MTFVSFLLNNNFMDCDYNHASIRVKTALSFIIIITNILTFLNFIEYILN